MTTIDWETLNAYVDRELAPADAARVAAAAARDPSIAARVASLAALKAGAAAVAAPDDAPEIPIPPRKPYAVGWRPIAIAASVALLAAAGAATWPQRPHFDADPIVGAVAAERTWLTGAQTDAPAAGVRVAVAAGASDSLPDLSAADLRLAYLAADPAADRPRGLFAGYVGPKGCRLGLWIGPGEEAETLPAARDVGDVMVRSWSADGRAYALMSRGMDARRLDRFAAVVSEIARRGRRVDDGLRLALLDASRTGAACVG
ncbi:hypothetical protein [Methylopila sp. M107]|uniref:hypothetical protein n=1 Tax=Methylopila sp. M107 TaxID=1101190 RepID=UPI00037DEDEB|nr:hypothetical protein [Methylopila sp. M107]